MNIDLDNLKKSKLLVEEYLLLQMYYEGLDASSFDWGYPEDEAQLYFQKEGYIKILEDSIEPRQKLIDLFEVKGTNPKDWIEQWCELWPKGVKSGGYYVKPNVTDALTNMTKFCKKYKFTKDQIFEATGNYLKEKERDNWTYCMLGAYFIMKNNMSQLATCCMNLGTKASKEVSINKMI